MSLIPDLADWESMESDEEKSDEDNEILKKRYNFFTTDDEGDPKEKLEEPMEEDKLEPNETTNGDASEEVMSTEMEQKKEKRKSEVDGVELQQNDGIENAIEAKKKKKSVSISEV
ncbi:hypothetical protein MKW98_013512 [Papaver atlanticum]|uniref:Uncharacterized protein n=1 Tax=Papaver atlanticum TaxID=357466 RepID=A0AAD4SV75_9MAGN|nr:hypothetical protein MKW98_013512 [Papaver atlanticum]